MSEEDDTEMTAQLRCGICYDILRDAVETNCCHQLFCADCLKALSSCPMCRESPFGTHISHVARRMIDSLSTLRISESVVNKYDCPYEECGFMTESQHEFDRHLLACSYRVYSCAAPGCSFYGMVDGYVKHLAEQHQTELVNNAAYLFHRASIDGGLPYDFITSTITDDPVDGALNESGHIAVLGASGKFFCGESVLNCSCCGKRCGPIAGCNCKACMKLDVQKRKLGPGFLVNVEGFASRRGSSGRFYCGRLVVRRLRACDTRCGPDEGVNCPPCRKLDIQAHTIYQGLA